MPLLPDPHCTVSVNVVLCDAFAEVAVTVIGYVPGVVPGSCITGMPELPPQALVNPLNARISSAASAQRSRMRRWRVAARNAAPRAASRLAHPSRINCGLLAGAPGSCMRGATSDGAVVVQVSIT